MIALDDRIEALRSLSTGQLRQEWQRVWKEPAPRLGHDLLRRGIVWKLQEQEQGGLPRSVTRELERLARQLERGRPLGLERTAKPGTRLVRQWRGRTFHVAVMDDGFLFEDRRYASLSQIAQVITGTKWSGPRFFGLAGGPAAEVVGGEG
ncbi:MAG: DUF2924 domain-containing protein [Pseudomonadota bacterium]|nr:DUF2924 domain-containing protein [Pseudomonadota bacterium]